MRSILRLVPITGCLVAGSASALPIQDGAYWPFRGTVTTVSVDHDLGCCDLKLAEGDTVYGSVTATRPSNLGFTAASATFQVPGGAFWGAFGSPALVTDGMGPPPGTAIIDPDTLQGGSALDTEFLPGARPGWSLEFGDGSFSLIDYDGTAWSGINPRTGQFFPDYAPSASEFELARITFHLNAVDESAQTQAFTIEVHIDEFLDPRPVPEPSLALLALISSAAAVRRAGRADARASCAGRATPG